MLFAYRENAGHLEPIGTDAPLSDAIWADLYRPMPAQTAQITALGVEVPTLEDMEEIEISNRIYRENGADYMTVVLPGLSETKVPISGPVTFILTPTRLVTVRHHAPRPFETYPTRADKVGPGCFTPERVFLGLIDEIIGRLADLLEASGKALDVVTRDVYREGGKADDKMLLDSLRQVGREGDLVGKVRLSLLTIERALSYFSQALSDRKGVEGLRPVLKGLTRDIQALEIHADFLSSRVAMASDATLGMINLSQNATIKIVSVVAVVFLPPTVIASAYGMNFERMPELAWTWGYPMALVLMVASAVGTYFFFKWKHWL